MINKTGKVIIENGEFEINGFEFGLPFIDGSFPAEREVLEYLKTLIEDSLKKLEDGPKTEIHNPLKP